MSNISISGLFSNLDTDALVNAMLSSTDSKIAKLKAQQTALEAQDKAWSSIQSLATKVTSASAELVSSARLFAPVSTSSSDAVSVTGSVAEGSSLSFAVTQLARSGQQALSGFSSLDQVVGAGTVTVATASGGSQTLTFGPDATVGDIANAIKGTGLASAAAYDSGDSTRGFEMLITSSKTGVANEATVTFSGFAQNYNPSSVRSAQDAILTMGSQTVKRATNTIDDLIPGMTIKLNKTTTEDVTVASEVKPEDVGAKVKAFVDSLNSLIAGIASSGKNQPGATDNGALAGSSQLRDMNLALMKAVTSNYGDGSVSLFSQIGVRVERNGTLSYDEAAFKKALDDDRGAVTSFLTRSTSSASPLVSFGNATTGTPAGDHAVVITQAATKAAATTSAFPAAAGDFSFKMGDKTATLNIPAGASGSTVADMINGLLSANKLRAEAAWDGSSLHLTSKDYGSAGSFEVSGSFWAVNAEGVDVAGTINGQAATGSGQTLTAPATGTASGLALKITATPSDLSGGALALGSVSYSPGISGFFNAWSGQMRDAGGVFDVASTTSTSTKKSLASDIETAERNRAMRETTLRNQFAYMEKMLAQLKSSAPDFSALSTDIYSGK